MENNDVRFRRIDERMDRTDRLVDALHEEMTALAGKMAALAGAQSHTESKMSALIDAQIRTETHVARLESACLMLAELAKSMDDRMDSSDQRTEALHQEMTSLTAKMAALVDAQILTEAKFAESRETLTQVDDRLKALTHIVDRHISGNGHEHSS